MAELQADGATTLVHLEKVAAKLGRDPDELAEYNRITPPDEVLYLWDYFRSMSERRQTDDGHPLHLPCESVESWARLNGVRLAPWEMRVIDRLEQEVVGMLREQVRKKLEEKMKAIPK